MSAHELREYLQIVLDMEKHKYLQEATISRLKEKCDVLGKAQLFYRPVPPTKPQLLGGIVIAILSGTVAAFGIYLFITSIQILENGNFIESAGSLLFLLPFSVAISIAGVVGLCHKLGRLSNESSAYDIQKMKYDDAERNYQQAVSCDALRVKEELAEKAALSASLQILLATHAESIQALKKLYDKNILFPKYRNLAMIASLHEYICSGRCSLLEGPDGGYNLLETEMRLDRIVTQIDAVVSHLEKIQRNQYTLYSALNDARHVSAQLLSSTYQIADQVKASQLQNQKQTDALIANLHKHSALTAYQNERIHAELNYANRMDFHTGRNKGVYSNIPPT